MHKKEIADLLKKGFLAYRNREYRLCIDLLDRFCHESKSDIQRKAVEITRDKAIERLEKKFESNDKNEKLKSKIDVSVASETINIAFLAGNFDQMIKSRDLINLINQLPNSHLIVDLSQVDKLKNLSSHFQSIIISPNKLNGFGTLNYILSNFPLIEGSLDAYLNVVLIKSEINGDLLKELLDCELIDSTINEKLNSIILRIRVNHQLIERIGYILPFSFEEIEQQELPSLLLGEYVLRYCRAFEKIVQPEVANETSYLRLKEVLLKTCATLTKSSRLSRQSLDIIEYVRLSIVDSFSRVDFIPINPKSPAQLLAFIKHGLYSNIITANFDLVLYITDEFEVAVGEGTNRLQKNQFGEKLLNATKLLLQFDLNGAFFLAPCKLDFKIDYEPFVREVMPPVPITYIHLIPSSEADDSLHSIEPTVSVVMSYYNSPGSIWYVLFSLAIQTLKPREIMIGDDCSDENSKRVLGLLRWLYPGLPIKIVENDYNIGTYATRNRLILDSTSEWIAINDSDDFSLRNRFRHQYLHARKHAADAVYSNHARISHRGNVVAFLGPQGEIKSRRPSMASYFYRTALHPKLGYYFSHRKGSDSEWHQRLVRDGVTRKLSEIELLQVSDFESEQRLTSDMFVVRSSERYVTFYQSVQSTERRQIADQMKSQLQRSYFIRPAVQSTSIRKVVGNMATIPDRLIHLERVLVAILPQVDEFNLYLNNFSDEFNIFEVCPKISLYKKKITLIKSQEIGDRREVARFTKINQYNSDWYFACFDDDIIYPSNYVDKLVFTSTFYQDQVALCVHGYSFWEELVDFTNDPPRQSRYFHFKELLSSDSIVDVAGVGTLFIPADLIDNDFAEGPFGFNDLLLADYLFRKSIPVFAISRHKGWLSEITYENSLYREAKRDDSPAQLFAIKLQKTIGIWNRDFCNLNHIIGVNAAGLYSSAPSLLTRDQDIYPIYICATGFNTSKNVKYFCESLRVALFNVFSSKVRLLFLDDYSSDETGSILRDECSRRLGRYNWHVITTEKREGPAVGRARLLNEARREVGQKLIIMLDLDDSVTPLFGRFLTQVIQQGYCHKIYCGGWFFGGKIKRPWQALHGMTGDRIDQLAQMPFSWQHVRMWWEDTEEEMDFTRLRIGSDGILYCSDVAFFMALRRDLCSETLVSRTYDQLYSYVYDTPGGTIATYGPIKNATACYLLANR